MKVSYNWLKNYADIKIPVPQLVDILTTRFFEVSGIEKFNSDYVFNIDVLPNRAHDCLSHIGIAKEIAALLKSKISIKESKLKEDKNFNIKKYLVVRVEEPTLCRRYIGRAVIGVNVGPSPKWLKERLLAIGQKSINNVVDAANYVMFEYGQPLHIFDFDKIKGKKTVEIIVRKAAIGENIVTLDDEKYELNRDILVIADSKEPLAIAGIKGGKKAEINNGTKNIIIEAANFEPSNIRRASGILGLRTESSIRFENEISPYVASVAMERLAGLIQEIAGGKIASGKIDFYPKKFIPAKVSVTVREIERILGTSIVRKEIVEIFKRIGFEIVGDKSLKNKEEDALTVIVPPERIDICFKEDLIEEIARIYGYDKISARLPFAVLIAPKRNDLVFWERKAQNIMARTGFNEVYNYSFGSEEDLIDLGFNPIITLSLLNPISDDKKFLRPSLLINLLKNIKDNFRFFDELRMFEIGKIFSNGAKRGGIAETKSLAGVISYKSSKNKIGKEFYELKGAIDFLFDGFGISDYWYDDAEPSSDGRRGFWHEVNTAEIKIGNKKIGMLGEINPVVLKKFGIDFTVAAFEIDFEKLASAADEEFAYASISKYPSIIRDLAILTPLDTRVEETLNIIENAGGALLYDVELFDIYEGSELPEGMKSLAFRLIFQSNKRTLSEKEIGEIMAKIISEAKQMGWEIR